METSKLAIEKRLEEISALRVGGSPKQVLESMISDLYDSIFRSDDGHALQVFISCIMSMEEKSLFLKGSAFSRSLNSLTSAGFDIGDQLLHVLENEEEISLKALQAPEFFEYVLLSLKSSSISHADVASKILVSSQQVTTDQSTRLVDAFSTSTDSTIRLRLLQVISKLAGSSNSNFEILESTGAVQIVCRFWWESDDILAKTVAIELLSDLAKCSSGLSWLLGHGVFDKLLETVESGDPVMSSQAMRELSRILSFGGRQRLTNAQFWQDMHGMQADKIVHIVATQLTDSSEEAKLAALFTLTELATAEPSLLSVVVRNHEVKAAWSALLSSKVELQRAALKGVANVIAKDFEGLSEESARAVSDSKQQLYSMIGEARRQVPTAYLMRLVQSPVESTRLAAMEVLRAAAKEERSWSVQALVGNKEFRDFIGAPARHDSKIGREWRYSILEALSRNPLVRLADAEFAEKLQRLVLLGPFHLPPRSHEVDIL